MPTRKAAATPLRAVRSGEKAPPPRKRAQTKTVSQAAAGGDQRELLVAMRDRIAKTVESPGCPPRDLAALSRRLIEIARDIEAIDAAAEEEAEDGAVPPDEEFDASSV